MESEDENGETGLFRTWQEVRGDCAWPRKLAVEMNRREWIWDKFWRKTDRIYTDRTWDVKKKGAIKNDS